MGAAILPDAILFALVGGRRYRRRGVVVLEGRPLLGEIYLIGNDFFGIFPIHCFR
jgi:hypothetical protein